MGRNAAGAGVQAGKKQQPVYLQRPGSHEPLARVDRAAPGEADEVLYYHTDVNGAPEEMTDGGAILSGKRAIRYGEPDA